MKKTQHNDSLVGASFKERLSSNRSLIPTENDKVESKLSKKHSVRDKRSYFVVFGGLLIHLCLGGQYITGNLLPYIASFLASKNGSTEDDNNYNYYSDICTWIYPLQAIGQSISMAYGGKLENKIGPRYTVLVGGFILCLGVFLTTWTCSNFYLLLITYAMMHGIGIGIIYSSPLICSMKWFPDNKGFVNGIIVAGFGSSPIIFTQIMTQLINPHNHTLDANSGFLKDPNVLNNVPSFFTKLAAMYASGIIIGALLLKNPDIINTTNDDDTGSSIICLSAVTMNEKENKGQKKVTEKSSLIEHDEYFSSSMRMRWNRFYEEYSLEVTRSWTFWNLWFTFMFAAGAILTFFASQWKELSNKHLGIQDDFILSVMGSTASIFNALGRVVFGKLFDYTNSYRLTMSIMMFTVTVLLFTWPYIDNFGLNEDIVIIFAFIWICLLFLFFTGVFSIYPSFIAQTWGTTKTAVILGYIFLAGIPGNLFTVQLIIQIRNLFGWNGLCYSLGSLGVIVLCLVLTINVKCK